MDDTAYGEFFTQPTQTYHRRYEALRAVFVEGRTQKDVAEEFGFTYGSMRQLVLEFRQSCDTKDESTESPFFVTSVAADSTKTKGWIQPQPIDVRWFFPVANHYASEQESPEFSCSCHC